MLCDPPSPLSSLSRYLFFMKKIQLAPEFLGRSQTPSSATPPVQTGLACLPWPGGSRHFEEHAGPAVSRGRGPTSGPLLGQARAICEPGWTQTGFRESQYPDWLGPLLWRPSVPPCPSSPGSRPRAQKGMQPSVSSSQPRLEGRPKTVLLLSPRGHRPGDADSPLCWGPCTLSLPSPHPTPWHSLLLPCARRTA